MKGWAVASGCCLSLDMAALFLLPAPLPEVLLCPYVAGSGWAHLTQFSPLREIEPLRREVTWPRSPDSHPWLPASEAQPLPSFLAVSGIAQKVLNVVRDSEILLSGGPPAFPATVGVTGLL